MKSQLKKKMKDSTLERLTKLFFVNLPEKLLDRQRTHSCYIGIIDDNNIEIMKVDHKNPHDIYKKTIILQYRVRFNNQRNSKLKGFWIPKSLEDIVLNNHNRISIRRYLEKISFNYI